MFHELTHHSKPNLNTLHRRKCDGPESLKPVSLQTGLSHQAFSKDHAAEPGQLNIIFPEIFVGGLDYLTLMGDEMLIDGEEVDFAHGPVDASHCLKESEMNFIERLSYRTCRHPGQQIRDEHPCILIVLLDNTTDCVESVLDW